MEPPVETPKIIRESSGGCHTCGSLSLMQIGVHMAQLCARFARRSLEKILEKTKRDSYFDAEEAVPFSLAGRIIQIL